MKKLVISSLLAMAAVGAQAQTYGEIGYTSISYEEPVEGYTVKSKPKALRGLVGYELSENLALEGIVGIGLDDADVTVVGRTIPGVKLKIDNMYGFYVTPKMKLAENFEGFVRAGFASASGTVSANGQTSSGTTDGLSYGLGVRYSFDKNTSVSVDYMSYFDKSDSKATGFTVGVGFRF